MLMCRNSFSSILRYHGVSFLKHRRRSRHFPWLGSPVCGALRWFSARKFSKRGDNIILMGSPGAAKTTVGRLVAQSLGKQAIDVDNDHLEKVWNMTVAEKLMDVGSDGFIEAEGQALLQLSCNNSVISLSGSNPMHQLAMSHISTLGTVIYLDVDDYDILERLEKMKVDRIVGQNDGTSVCDILKYRKQFYEGSYDVRVICERNEYPESITRKVIDSVNQLAERGVYVSTRQRDTMEEKTFFDVVLEGLAPDGGLYVPGREIPRMTLGEMERLVPCSYQERALRILEQWIHPLDLHSSILKQMIDNAYQTNFEHPGIAPVEKLDKQVFILELFHGPTASFKDLALQLTPHFFNKAVNLSHEDTKYVILVATSGDTGSAVLEGFRDSGSADVFVLYPLNGVSTIQRKQMITTDSANSGVMGVNGDFDFCQSSIKKLFNDISFCELLQGRYNVKLSAANSINWGRLLPQVVYHVSSYLDLVKIGVISMGEKADVCVPTGNFGNILGAFYAKEMGIPFDNIICASNVNNVLTEFFNNGIYDICKRNLHRTVSPSIDIFKSSNLERLIYHVTSRNTELVTQLFNSLETDGKFQVGPKLHKTLSSTIKSGWSDEHACLDTIKTVYSQTGYLLDPHTAIAKSVADNFISPDKPMIVSATAHCSKFADNVLKALNKECSSSDPLALMQEVHRLEPRPPMHKHLADAMKKPEIHDSVCSNDVEAVKNRIEQFLRIQR